MEGPFLRISEPGIVFERGGIIVVSKPAGMHCAPGTQPGTLCSWLFTIRPGLAGIAGHAPGEGGLLHRLDSATSGLVAFASDDAAFKAMALDAADGRFKKTYRALGLPAPGGLPGSRPLSGVPDGVDARAWETALRISDAGKLSIMVSGTRLSCRFRPYGPGASRVACSAPDGPAPIRGSGKAWTKAVYTSDFCSAQSSDGGVLVEITLTRGFRHQIRAQMAWLGLGLKGDPVYGDADEGEDLHLQASRLEFNLPGGETRGGASLVVVDLDACQ